MTTKDPLDTLAEQLSAVSPKWKEHVRRTLDRARRAKLNSEELMQGVEAIYEGYALHFATDSTRVVKTNTDEPSRLLLGDWCYAAGLCDVAQTGKVQAVRTLADLIADVAALASEDRDPSAPDAREVRWDSALAQLDQDSTKETE